MRPSNIIRVILIGHDTKIVQTHVGTALLVEMEMASIICMNAECSPQNTEKCRMNEIVEKMKTKSIFTTSFYFKFLGTFFQLKDSIFVAVNMDDAL